jgi:prepilin-type N-terminal cleavage/methylation domain-containing protein
MCGRKAVYKSAFTFVELVVVLALISVMAAAVLPFCKRSNDALKLRQHSSSIAQALRYAIDLAEKRNKAVRFVFSEKYASYYLEIEESENSFRPVDDFTGAERFLDKIIFLFDIEGFEQSGQEYFLVFDPQRPWPEARITLSAGDLTETVRVKSKYVDIEEESI